jgi:hypothetical protein
MAKIQRSYYLEADLAKWLKVTAAKFGVSASELLTMALEHFQAEDPIPPRSEAESRAMLDITDSLE